MKKAISLTLALVMALSLVSCGSKDSDGNSSNTGNNSAGSTGGSSASQSTTDGDYTYSGRLTLGGSDSTGQMYAAAATIATTFSASIDGLDVSATTSSGSNENALNVHDGVVELGCLLYTSPSPRD